MESGAKKLTNFNNKKTQRFQVKKRKLEALLNLFDDDQTEVGKAKKTGESLGESYKALKDELKKYVKKPEVEPSFYLTDHGFKAQINLKNFDVINESSTTVDPLFIEDVYQLLLRSVIGHQSPFPLNWAKLEQPQNIRKTVLLVVEGFSKRDVLHSLPKLITITDVFPYAVQIMSSNIHFATELCSLHLVTDFHLQEKGSYSTMFPKDKEVKIETDQDFKRPSKLHLILSPIQMVMENYPFPQSVFNSSNSEDYFFTKDAYSPVTKKSPLFAIDCEMCLTDVGANEVTRIAVVDENLDVVYHTLVKPHNKIVNYMTRYSGITKDMLVDVDVRLCDVQMQLRTILPPDAILCGQSLNCDLHALKMIHPYVIDTSIIFNCSGIRGKKDSLKNLTMIHLNEVIQNGKKGHNPIEDCIATMRLVQLKLANNVQYGDACLSNNHENGVTNEASSANENGLNNNSNTSTVNSVGNSKNGDGFFAKLLKFSKKTCLIGNRKSLDKYDTDMLNENVHKYTKSSTKKILKTTLQYMNDFDLVLSHMTFDLASKLNSAEELNDAVKQLHDSCVDKTTFMVLLSGINEEEFEDIKNGLFLVTLKKC